MVQEYNIKVDKSLTLSYVVDIHQMWMDMCITEGSNLNLNVEKPIFVRGTRISTVRLGEGDIFHVRIFIPGITQHKFNGRPGLST